MYNSNIIVIIGVSVIVAFLGIYYYFYQKDKKSNPSVHPPATPVTEGTRTLQLQAYERLVILADRIAIPNLVSRNNQPGLDKADMQLLLTGVIKQEFEHNLSQ